MTNINTPVLHLVEQGDTAYKNKDYEAAESLYKQALELAERTGAETNYVYSCLAKVLKKKANGYQQAYEMSLQAVPTTAGFRDSAICLRKIVKHAKQVKDEQLLRETLEEFYRLAVLAYLCYERHDCKTGARGSLYDRARIICEMLELRQINATYQTHGVLEGGGLLTKTDYKLFESVFGVSDKVYNPIRDFSALTMEVNNRFIVWLKEYFMNPPKDSGITIDSFWIKMANESLTDSIEWFRQNAPWAIND